MAAICSDNAENLLSLSPFRKRYPNFVRDPADTLIKSFIVGRLNSKSLGQNLSCLLKGKFVVRIVTAFFQVHLQNRDINAGGVIFSLDHFGHLAKCFGIGFFHGLTNKIAG